MAITNGYATLTQIKTRLRISDSTEDTLLEDVVTGASRAIDRWCSRRFYAASETRYYTAISAVSLDVDDLLTVTTLKTDEGGDRTYEYTWSSSTDYYLAPYNAALNGMPYWRIEADVVNGRYSFPPVPRGVELAGSFGYCATGSHPQPIHEACLRVSERLYKLRDAPLGVAGSTELGLIRIGSDRDVQDLIWPYKLVQGIA